jgi:hypothetical protein
MIEWEMPDKSIFKMDELQEKAFKMKIKAEGITAEDAREAFVPEVKLYWKKKAIPTKFGFDETWKECEDMKEEPKNMAELADFVLYPKIRAAMMGLIMSEMYKEDKKKKVKPKEVKVIAMNDDGGATVYGGDGKVKRHKNWRKALPKGKK